MRSTRIGQFKMDKKKILIAVAAVFGVFMLLGLVSTCSDSSSSNSQNSGPKLVKPAQTEVKGDLKGFFEVVDKETKVTYEQSREIITVELMRTNKELPFDHKDITIFPEAEKSEKSMVGGFGIELLDSTGTVIDKIEAKATPYSWDEMEAALQTLPGETATLKFHFYANLDNVATYRIISLVEKNSKKEKEESTVNKVIDKAIESAEKDIDENLDDMKEALEVTKDIIEVEKKLLDALD